MDDAFNGCKLALYIGDRLLVCLRDDRPDIPYPAHWDFPGGGREGDETPLETIRRELDEEFGLDLPDSALLWQRRIATNENGDAVWFFVARLPEGTEAQILFGDEGAAWALMPPARFLALPDAVPVIKERLRLWLDHNSRETIA